MKLPLSIRDVAPGAGAIRLTGTRHDGLPDGFHTGGAWLFEDRVWKPLDGRPFANADYHYPTLEAECLEELAGAPYFPRNWTVEEANGRRFLVRDEAYVLTPQEARASHYLPEIEQALRYMNSFRWELGDEVSVALSRQGPFILDLSNVGRCKTDKPPYAADDDERMRRYCRAAGDEYTARLRERAKHLLDPLQFEAQYGVPLNKSLDYRYVYASFYRPLSTTWAKRLPEDALLIPGGDRSELATPHTWVVTTAPLDPDVVYAYELTWGWSPIAYVKEAVDGA
jgi:hypothetical protein